MVDVKICGLRDASSLKVAIKEGASYVGFVFYPSSPRALTPSEAAALITHVPSSVTTVGLFVDPSDEDLKTTLDETPLQLIQLHGEETPERIQEIKNKTHKPVMKVIKLENADDLKNIDEYEKVSDWLMFDAKAPSDSSRPGGNARSFNWSLLKGRSFSKPWMLAGGLHAGNVAEAILISGAQVVDVSSGVEDRPGHKDPDKIRMFLAEARHL